jgi:hypothetical protein
MKSRYVVSGLALLAASCIGGLLGWNLHERYAAAATMLAQSGTIVSEADALERAYRDGTEFDRELALTRYLAVLEVLSSQPKGPPTGALDTDIALTYARLALIQDRKGKASAAEEYMDRAVSLYAEGAGRKVTGLDLQKLVERLDSARPVQ